MASEPSVILRDYQNNAIKDILSGINDRKNTVIQLPTGTGKTTVIAEALRIWRSNYGKNQRSLVVVHRVELVEQIIERFMQFGIKAGKIKAGEPVNTNFQIQVGLIQSLRNPARRPVTLGLIIVDEAHHINASSYSDLISYYDTFKPTVIGVTATPSRLDGKPLGAVFSQLFEYGQITNFINSGFLSPMKHYATGFPELKKIKVKSTGDYDEKALVAEMSNEKIMANLIKGYEMHSPNKKMIVFAVNTEHAVNIANRYCGSGFSAVALDYKTDNDTRRQTVEDFKNGKIQILVNVNLFTEGFDCPDVEVIQLARPTKSLNLYLQMVGRGMRIFPGKECGIILDNAKLWEEHGLISRYRNWTINGLNKSADKTIKVRLKNDSDEESNRDIEIPQESNQLELIEIVDDYNPKQIELQNDDKHLDEISKVLLIPNFIDILMKKLDSSFFYSENNLNLDVDKVLMSHYITGQKMSKRAVCRLIGLNIKSDQKTISRKKIIYQFDIFTQSVIKENIIINWCYNLIFRWSEKQSFYYPFIDEVMPNETLIKILSAFHERKAFRLLDLSEEFKNSITKQITMEQVEEIREQIIKKHQDDISRDLRELDKDFIELADANSMSIRNQLPIITTEEKNTADRKVTFEPSVNVSGNKEYRLAKVASELNRSFQALADLLNQQGFDVMPKPTTKITEEMYQTLLSEFSIAKGKVVDKHDIKNRILIKVSLELNSNWRNVALYLKENGFVIKHPKPTSIISNDMYNFLVENYTVVK
jgi:superfamily II DNA or RNA helicase